MEHKLNIDFNLAVPQDIAELLDMMEDFYAIDNYPFHRESTKTNMAEFISDLSLGRIYLLKHDQTTVGYLILAFGYSFEHGGKLAFVDDLFIKKDFRGKGMGSLAMDFIEREARNIGLHMLHLEVEPHNLNAVKLYDGKGFVKSKRYLLSKKIR